MHSKVYTFACGPFRCRSAVVVHKRRAWRYLHVVAALNWWQALFYRHMWGDKDTWALAAIALDSGAGDTRAGDTGAGDADAGDADTGDADAGDTAAGGTGAGATGPGPSSSAADSAGSRVGWLGSKEAAGPPRAIWGHVQFIPRTEATSGCGAERAGAERAEAAVGAAGAPAPLSEACAAAAPLWEPLYLNWQPHFAAGHIELLRGAAVRCCVFLEEHWQGPHALPRLHPELPQHTHRDAVARALNATAQALRELDPPGGERLFALLQPHWLHNDRLRSCLLCHGAMVGGLVAVGISLAGHAALRGVLHERQRGRIKSHRL